MDRGIKDTEAAKNLGVAPQTLRNMRCQGKGPPYFRIGRAVRYSVEDLNRYIEARKVDPESNAQAA